MTHTTDTIPAPTFPDAGAPGIPVPDGEGGTLILPLPPVDTSNLSSRYFPASLSTLDKIQGANWERGGSWFAPETLRFFSSRVHPTVYPPSLFVTSERSPWGPRRYSLRYCTLSGDIETVGDFGAFATSRAAHRAAERLSRAWWIAVGLDVAFLPY